MCRFLLMRFTVSVSSPTVLRTPIVSLITMNAKTMLIANSGDCIPSVRKTPNVSAATTAAWELGIPPVRI